MTPLCRPVLGITGHHCQLPTTRRLCNAAVPSRVSYRLTACPLQDGLCKVHSSTNDRTRSIVRVYAHSNAIPSRFLGMSHTLLGLSFGVKLEAPVTDLSPLPNLGSEKSIWVGSRNTANSFEPLGAAYQLPVLVSSSERLGQTSPQPFPGHHVNFEYSSAPQQRHQ
jgi:hypothetical protein